MIDAREAERITPIITPAMVREQIERLGWTQGEAAAYLRVDPRTMRRWLASTESPTAAPIPFAYYALLRLTRKAA
jgi:hypothetical protein